MGIRYVNLIKSLVEPAQKIEDAFIAMYSAFSLPNAIGVQLDKLGDRVGQKRNGMLDADYKLAIKARILANRSTGSHKDLKRIALIFTNVYSVQSGGGVALVNVGVLDNAKANLLFSFLVKAVASTVRLQMQYQATSNANAFTLAAAAVTTADSIVGTQTLPIVDGLLLPDFGNVKIGFGTSLQETCPYTSRDNNFLYGVTCFNVHPTGSAVQFNDVDKGLDNGFLSVILESP